ncbi:hypothetical protein Drorol1_Dr00016675 [Drosera rotundifolia]
MGKKKLNRKKTTEEITPAIPAGVNENSSWKLEAKKEAQAPRKRGRPRKIMTIVEKAETEHDKGQLLSENPEDVAQEDEKRMKVPEEDEDGEQAKAKAKAAAVSPAGDYESWTKEIPKGRTRRKSKPHKSR